MLLQAARYGSDSDCGPRRPHRHDYHELVWTRCGTGRHPIDGEVSLVEPLTATNLLFAMALSRWLSGQPLGWNGWLGVALLALGVMSFIVAGQPSGGVTESRP